MCVPENIYQEKTAPEIYSLAIPAGKNISISAQWYSKCI